MNGLADLGAGSREGLRNASGRQALGGDVLSPDQLDFEINLGAQPLEVDENDLPVSLKSYKVKATKFEFGSPRRKSKKGVKTDDALKARSAVERKPKVVTNNKGRAAILDNVSMKLGSIDENDVEDEDDGDGSRPGNNKRRKGAKGGQPKAIPEMADAKNMNSTAQPRGSLVEMAGVKKIEVQLESANSMKEMDDESFSDDDSNVQKDQVDGRSDTLKDMDDESFSDDGTNEQTDNRL